MAITAQQEQAWQAYAAKLAEQVALMQASFTLHHQTADVSVPGPDRVHQRITLMSQHLAGIRGLQTALKELYATLTPAQRAMADQLSWPMVPCGGWVRGMHN